MSSSVARFVKFAGVGGAATALQYVLLVAMVEGFYLAPLCASVCSYVISALFNYRANYQFTFAVNLPHRRVLPRFMLVSGCGLIINSLIFYLLHSKLGLVYLLAQVVATGFVLFWSFTVNHLWAFAGSSGPKG